MKAPPSNVSFLQAPGLVFSGVLSTLKGTVPCFCQILQLQASFPFPHCLSLVAAEALPPSHMALLALRTVCMPFQTALQPGCKHGDGGLTSRRHAHEGEPVQRQQRQQQARAEPLRFQGEVQDQHTTASGCEYVRITMTPTSAAAPNVIDAEFLFPSGGSFFLTRIAIDSSNLHALQASNQGSNPSACQVHVLIMTSLDAPA